MHTCINTCIRARGSTHTTYSLSLSLSLSHMHVCVCVCVWNICKNIHIRVSYSNNYRLQTCPNPLSSNKTTHMCVWNICKNMCIIFTRISAIIFLSSFLLSLRSLHQPPVTETFVDTSMSHEEEDSCHMRRSIHVAPYGSFVPDLFVLFPSLSLSLSPSPLCLSVPHFPSLSPPSPPPPISLSPSPSPSPSLSLRSEHILCAPYDSGLR